MSKDLRFRSLRLQNWKNFARVEVAIQDRVFLVAQDEQGLPTLRIPDANGPVQRAGDQPRAIRTEGE